MDPDKALDYNKARSAWRIANDHLWSNCHRMIQPRQMYEYLMRLLKHFLVKRKEWKKAVGEASTPGSSMSDNDGGCADYEGQGFEREQKDLCPLVRKTNLELVPQKVELEEKPKSEDGSTRSSPFVRYKAESSPGVRSSSCTPVNPRSKHTAPVTERLVTPSTPSNADTARTTSTSTGKELTTSSTSSTVVIARTVSNPPGGPDKATSDSMAFAEHAASSSVYHENPQLHGPTLQPPRYGHQHLGAQMVSSGPAYGPHWQPQYPIQENLSMLPTIDPCDTYWSYDPDNAVTAGNADLHHMKIGGTGAIGDANNDSVRFFHPPNACIYSVPHSDKQLDDPREGFFDITYLKQQHLAFPSQYRLDM